MAKSIYPGNWVNRLSSYQGQPVIAIPGRRYYHVVGYALVGSTAAASFDVIIPSPDRRGDDKPRADITGLVIPSGAYLYKIGIRVPDMRKDRAYGTAFSGLALGTAANTNRLRLASSATATDNALTGTPITEASTDSSALSFGGGTTIAPAANTVQLATMAQPVSGNLTLKVYTATSAGNVAGGTISSTLTGGTPIICEAMYWIADSTDVPDLEGIRRPFITEAGAGS